MKIINGEVLFSKADIEAALNMLEHIESEVFKKSFITKKVNKEAETEDMAVFTHLLKKSNTRMIEREQANG